MFIENTYREPFNQDESMGMRFINRMAIHEEDQFEIAAVETLVEDDQEKHDGDIWYQETIFQEKMNKALQAAKNLDKLRNKEQKEGSNNIHLSLSFSVFLVSCVKRDDFRLMKKLIRT